MKCESLGASLVMLVTTALLFNVQGRAEPGQERLPPQPPAAQQAPPDALKPPSVVLTGCLRSSPSMTPTADGTDRIFTLEVMKAPEDSTGASVTDVPAGASKLTYTLSAKPSVALLKHVDHQVELTGELQAPSTTAKGEPASSPSTSTSTAKPGGAHRTFEVSAVKEMPGKCP